MKTVVILIVLVSVLIGGGCSRAKEPTEKSLQSNPIQRSDIERLHEAMDKAAKERQRTERLQQSPSPSASP